MTYFQHEVETKPIVQEWKVMTLIVVNLIEERNRLRQIIIHDLV